MSQQRILVVDDVPEITQLLKYNLSKEGYLVETADTGAAALERLQSGFVGVILLDLRLPDIDGLDLFNQIKVLNENLPVIIITAHGTIDTAIRAIRAGAFDFITKTDNIVERLFVATKNAFHAMELGDKVQRLSREIDRRYRFDQVVTQSIEMQRVFKLVEHAIDSRVTVLLQGESGTGKEVLARALHYQGPRRDEPFVAINCAGIPDTLLESELFGYEKGAFTGAVGRRVGKFEQADGGTIFLDEIGEMSRNLQSKILRVLQEREFERLGGSEKIKVDVRIVSATNRNLLEEAKSGRFREDLYYRLSVFTVQIPPLRERRGDIPLLVSHFRKRFAEEEKKVITGIRPEALRLLEAYSYPGNVRELENLISHAVVVTNHEILQVEDLPLSFLREQQLQSLETLAPSGLTDGLERFIQVPEQIPLLDKVEEVLLRRAIEVCAGNLADAAQHLGISRATIYRRVERLGLKKA